MAESVSEWLGRLKTGEADAAQNLWERYAGELARVARLRLGDCPKGVADEDDIAQSVFISICRGAAEGRFRDVKSRDEVWWLLLAITRQKVINHVRREAAQKRGGGEVQAEADLAAGNHFSLDRLVGDTPTPEFLMILEEQYEGLLRLLRDDSLRLIAILRVEGYTVLEIATKLGVSIRAIERKLQLIRSIWSEEFSLADSEP